MKEMNPVHEALVREFASGWVAGCTDALTLALGQPKDGAPDAVPYTGPLPAEFIAWAERALEKLSEKT